MKLGKINFFLLPFFLYFVSYSILNAEDSISTTPLINLENLEPTFESDTKDVSTKNNTVNLKSKSIENKDKEFRFVEIIGLDKITAKTKKIKIEIGEKKNFGPLELKVLKCGKTKSLNLITDTAYLQVVDKSEKNNEKVFIFNGWAFSHPTSNNLFEHPVYDVWLSKCLKV